MAMHQNRKRPRAEDAPQQRPSKKLRAEGRAQNPSEFSPEFWDKLSKVWLTPRALRELDRRNNAQPAPKPPSPAVYTKNLARFARHGGPDLHHLRGYPESRDDRLKMSSSRASDSSRRTKSTKATTVASKARRSSAYDDDFEQHLIDHAVFPEGYEYTNNRQTPEPENMDETRLELLAARASLSPSHFTESAFRDFKKKNKAKSESTVMRSVIPIITGNASIPNESNLQFTNFQSLTEDHTVKAVPDFFDGALPGDIDKTVREDLSQMIVPTKHADIPVAPNFFLEIKAPRGGADVARRQACYDGAYGARAMHSLQSYRKEELVYDSKAYTYTSTYHAGTLRLYAHHVTAPTDPEGRPEYHMTNVDGWDMTGNIDSFRRGATAFRNARDLAQRHRDGFIQAANARARQSDVEVPPEAEITVAAVEQSEESTDEFVDCEDYAPQAVGTENYAASSHVDEEPALPQDLRAEDEEPSRESVSLGAEQAMSFATSFTSSFSQSQISSKRTRASHSPPSNSRPDKKHGSAKGTRQSASRRAVGSSTQASTSSGSAIPPPAPTEEYWMWSDTYQKWYYLNEDGSYTWEDGE